MNPLDMMVERTAEDQKFFVERAQGSAAIRLFGSPYIVAGRHSCCKAGGSYGGGEMSDVVSEITRQRGSVYGPFLHNALVAQAIKAALRNLPDPDNEGLRLENLPFDVRESLDLIALKMSRIVTGSADYLDNWDDIGGYAKIVADRIRGASR